MGNENEIKSFSSPYEEGVDYSKLKGFLGAKGVMVEPHDEVTRSDIIRWCEVMHDDNPLYTDEEYAKKSEYGGIIAPPSSVQAFTIDAFYAAMVRFRDGVTIDIEEPHSQVFAALDAAGYSSVMATSQDLEVFNPIKLGDRPFPDTGLVRQNPFLGLRHIRKRFLRHIPQLLEPFHVRLI